METVAITVLIIGYCWLFLHISNKHADKLSRMHEDIDYLQMLYGRLVSEDDKLRESRKQLVEYAEKPDAANEAWDVVTKRREQKRKGTTTPQFGRC